ncbi:nuclear transport factor 2 family protein [Pararhodobacter marinus]|uniref:nuclear transport factor 2 family protein n=1 Tax=Pararhodobacter marinus TaxID=2184063 RepID=UPI0035183689
MRVPPDQGWATKAGLLTLPPRQPVTAESVAMRLGIAELFARYGIAHDEVDVPAMRDLWAEDGVLQVSLGGPVFETHEGRDAICANFARVAGTQTDQRRHAVTNLEITLEGVGRASARAYGIVPAADGSGIRVVVTCVYTADLVCGAEGLWRFARLWIGMDDYAGRAPGAE